MTLKVIGSGLGRTGTLSLKHALEQLGFGPCHHMYEVQKLPESVPLWVQAGQGKANWDAIFKDFASAVDYPTAAFWRELAAAYPKAKIIHSVRDPEAWFKSTQKTIFAPSVRENLTDQVRPFWMTMFGTFADHMNDHDYMIDYFRRQTEEVERAIEPERLLIYDTKEGWAPLCAFLGVPVPDTPFPNTNSAEEFAERRLDKSAEH